MTKLFKNHKPYRCRHTRESGVLKQGTYNLTAREQGIAFAGKDTFRPALITNGVSFGISKCEVVWFVITVFSTAARF